MKNTRKDEKGSALIIVLAFLFLLTIVTIAFLSRSLLERQLSNASLNQNKIDLVAQGAAASIIGDLQQEIVAGSNPVSATGAYYPVNATSMIPATVGFTHAPPPTVDGLEDLLKVSQTGQSFFPTDANHPNGTPSDRASQIDTTQASLNFRSVSRARWNKALLLTKKDTTQTDQTPVDAFPTPDWIYVARDGSNPTAWDPQYESVASISPTTAPGAGAGKNPITQRYAYAVYDEGSTLDMNVAGSPATSSGSTLTYTTQQPYKNALAYADLTQLLGGSGLNSAQEEAFINGIVGWRNHGSGKASGTFPSYDLTANFPGTRPPTAPAAPFDSFVLSTPGGFLSAGGSATQSDNAFASRQQLLQFLQTDTFLKPTGLTALQMQTLFPYLGTFSRDISQPSYQPPSGRPKVVDLPHGGNNANGHDDDVNPSFLGVTVPSNATFTRNDGSVPAAGEPLVKKRFALNRIAWVTYNGPSQGRNMSDPDMQALINDGIPAIFLQEGTKANIQKYFGLDWDSTKNQWKYDINNVSSSGRNPIQKIAAMISPHDPDFFELLKATIGVGSLGKALANANSSGTGQVPPDGGSNQTEQPANYNYYAENSVDFQILQIGANIIDQFQPANYPIQIVFNDGGPSLSSKRTIVGVENLPYLDAVVNGVLVVKAPNPPPPYTSTSTIQASGVGTYMQIPVIWNPHDPSSPVGAVGPTSFRVLADSADPDATINGGTYNKFFAYGASSLNGTNDYTYSITAAPPGYPGVVATPANAVSFKNPSNGDGNAEIKFSTTGFSAKELCPEPFVLMRASGGTDSNGNLLSVSVPSSHQIHADPAVSASFQSGGLRSAIADPPGFKSPENQDRAGVQSYIGFYLGAFPLAWTPTGRSTPVSAAQSGAYLAQAVPLSTASCYMTYRMQYQDSSSNWVTYDTKYGKASDSDPRAFGVDSTSYGDLLTGYSGNWGFLTDPRTSRFGIMTTTTYDITNGSVNPPFPGPEGNQWGYFPAASTYAAGWLDTFNAIAYTTRPDGDSGFFCKEGWPSTVGPNSGWMAYVSNSSDTPVPGLAPGLLSQNNTDIFLFPHVFYGDNQGNNTQNPNYFADPDGIVRRAMGGFVKMGSSQSPAAKLLPAVDADTPPADTTVGLPMARAFNWSTNRPASPNQTIAPVTSANVGTLTTSQTQSRPYFLHRPFNSVAELGYVFSDTPWRNLDFFTAESGNVALLDAFCITDTTDLNGLVAGKVNLNTRQVPVLRAIIAAGYLDPVLQAAQAPLVATERIDSVTAESVAKALVARTTDTDNISNGTGPLQNVSELVGKWTKNTGSGYNYTPIKSLGRVIQGQSRGTLLASNTNGFFDGKLSYSGFSGGVWDTSNHMPYVNGVEDFTTATGSPKATSGGTAEDIYSAYSDSGVFSSNALHNGTLETVSYIQRFREAPVRALAEAGTTRVWNLMIDLIAQAGRFPSSATGLDKFSVEGERRYWIHVAIDRYTGKILDEQIEEVKE